ncbi:SDR family oxidoreductase [Sulfuricystis multivorans]|uniref:SDR family oxidoreductase n=1 Tax=Sulfuricystis multivorans TaxID=2211108 RepID=UPI000F84215C|nr:SDR family oxidoreductase [Sulfuricystis multivorans]
MDLGIRGKRALVCAASKGLGRACALALAAEGVAVTIVARGEAALQTTLAELQKVGAGGNEDVPPDADSLRKVGAGGTAHQAVMADITTPEGRKKALAACPDPDILVTNAGGPPPGDFRDWTREDWIRALDANMLTPIELIKATVDGMIARRFGRIVNITSAAVKAPIDVLGLSNGARAGLTGFVAGLARKTVRYNVTINNLLPGLFDTDRIRNVVGAQAQAKGMSYDEALAERIANIPAGRIGDPTEFGAACAFLCSAQAGYITGQNWLLDGGAYPGTF